MTGRQEGAGEGREEAGWQGGNNRQHNSGREIMVRVKDLIILIII